jgi:hypothetical protein
VVFFPSLLSWQKKGKVVFVMQPILKNIVFTLEVKHDVIKSHEKCDEPKTVTLSVSSSWLF